MTRGASGKPKTLGRLIFGEKRKQHSPPSSRHRSASRHAVGAVDVPAMNGKNAKVSSKGAINQHDWAVWRMQLNEQMAGGSAADRADPKLMRQYLQANHFYQQHSRDPSNGRYNGVRLLFSIPHAKVKPDGLDRSLVTPQNLDPMEAVDASAYSHRDVRSTSEDRTVMSGTSISMGTPMISDKTISQLRPKGAMYGKADDFHRTNEHMLATDAPRIRHTARNAYTAADRVHSTLQKAVKDGNVLEKIKAFEMQAAAAAQAESSIKLTVPIVNHRIQPIMSPIHSVVHRALSPAATYSLQQAVSSTPVVQQQQQPNGRAHRGRHIYPTPHRRDGNGVQMVGPDTRKGAHVLEPAHGDIILKRRTPSQKTVNDEDYSTTMMTSAALPSSQSHHRQASHHRHQHRRSSVSRSRHRQEPIQEPRKAVPKEKSRPKSQSKHKEPTAPDATSPSKSGSRYRWLKGRKETPTEDKGGEEKRDSSVTKSKKSSKNKKKAVEDEKAEPTKKASGAVSKSKATSSDNNRVYGVPNLGATEEIKPEVVSSPTPTRIDEEIEPEPSADTVVENNIYVSPKEDANRQNKPCDTTLTNSVERRASKAKNYRQKLSSTDGEILEKIEDDARFSRPTDDHAHHSELNDDEGNPDDDDEYKSEGDVFIEESLATSITNIPSPQHQSANVVPAHHPKAPAVDRNPSERRWYWSKESGGLIDKGNRKKKSNGLIRHESTQEDSNYEQTEEDTFPSEPAVAAVVPCHAVLKKPSFRIATIAETNAEQHEAKLNPVPVLYVRKASISKEQEPSVTDVPGKSSITDDFFDNGPHTNPEETSANLAPST